MGELATELEGADSLPVFRLDLQSAPEAANHARRFVKECLGPHLEPPTLTDVVLATSEVVANSILHSGSEEEPISLLIRLSDDVVRVEAVDGGGGFDVEATRADSTNLGLGLIVLSNIASSWGNYRQGRHHVWFEVPRRSLSSSRKG